MHLDQLMCHLPSMVIQSGYPNSTGQPFVLAMLNGSTTIVLINQGQYEWNIVKDYRVMVFNATPNTILCLLW
jgi:hypothetical protein